MDGIMANDTREIGLFCSTDDFRHVGMADIAARTLRLRPEWSGARRRLPVADRDATGLRTIVQKRRTNHCPDAIRLTDGLSGSPTVPRSTMPPDSVHENALCA